MHHSLRKTKLYFVSSLIIIALIASFALYSVAKTSSATQHPSSFPQGLVVASHHLASPLPGTQQKTAQTVVAKKAVKSDVGTTIDEEIRRLLGNMRNTKKI